MISQCCVCKIVEGVMCPQCGDFLVEEKPDINRSIDVYKSNTYMCTNNGCGLLYKGEEGGISHGYCKPCFGHVMSKVPKKVPAFALYNHGVVNQEE
jgi:hypothetical protein